MASNIMLSQHSECIAIYSRYRQVGKVVYETLAALSVEISHVVRMKHNK